MGKWISVKDKMPPDDEFVLIYHKGCSGEYSAEDPICLGYWICVAKSKIKNIFTEGLVDRWAVGSDRGFGEVTHWMPLPKSPEDENRDKE